MSDGYHSTDHHDDFPPSESQSSRYRNPGNVDSFPPSGHQSSRYRDSGNNEQHLADILAEAARLKEGIDHDRSTARLRFNALRYFNPDDRSRVYEGVAWADKDGLISLGHELREYARLEARIKARSKARSEGRIEDWRTDVTRQSSDERGKYNPRFSSPERRVPDEDGYYPMPERRDQDCGSHYSRPERRDPAVEEYSRAFTPRYMPYPGGDVRQREPRGGG